METEGGISAAEASAALASVGRSRARVAWTGYPRWYWLVTAAVLAVAPLATLLPDWLGLAVCAAAVVVLAMLAVAASRARGVCESWTRSAMRLRDLLLLYGPAVVVMLAGTFASRFAWWLPIVAAMLGFVLFAGTGLTLSARAGRR
ncbi:MAG: hypothetical protein GEV28_05450 [Actinophytocola sp.]|uniref:hypothetical protein n=1 Tax=Actinophytocola sp. TaxID=1872138 RepID=UPI001327F1C4|nr:hypothetical protein [Actinophytocola sp.]MPZ79860.1 hypothetical protein [Actinophytocola sp.]